jgi:hypothetical protein
MSHPVEGHAEPLIRKGRSRHARRPFRTDHNPTIAIGLMPSSRNRIPLVPADTLTARAAGTGNRRQGWAIETDANWKPSTVRVAVMTVVVRLNEADELSP